MNVCNVKKSKKKQKRVASCHQTVKRFEFTSMTFNSPPLSLNSTFKQFSGTFLKALNYAEFNYLFYYVLSLLTGICFIKNISAIFLFVMWTHGRRVDEQQVGLLPTHFVKQKLVKNIFKFVC
jgi:hypothetical protein